jgi:hypothetical protein
MVVGREKIATGCGSTGRSLSRKWVILLNSVLLFVCYTVMVLPDVIY